MKVTITFHNENPSTVWNKLAAKLGREPTHEEATAAVRQILRDAMCEQASRGRLPYQRK